MKYIHLLILAAIWLGACAPLVVNAPDSTDDLLSGQVLFGELIDVSDIRTDGILALDDEMRDYVASKVKRDPQARSRLRKLIRGMIDDGLLTRILLIPQSRLSKIVREIVFPFQFYLPHSPVR